MIGTTRPGTTALVVATLAALVLVPGVPGGSTSAPVPPDPDLDAALLAAAWDDDVDLAARLISAGADVNARDWTRQNAYLIAASEGYDEMLELTLAAGAYAPALDGYRGTALIRAAERGHASTVGRLLREEIPVDHVNRLGWTALHEAVILGDGSARYVDTVRLLIAGGADLERVSVRDDMTALEHARDLGQADVEAVLARAGAHQWRGDPTAALLEAATEGDADAAAIAIRNGADVLARGRDGTSVAELASRAGHDAVVRLLRYLAPP